MKTLKACKQCRVSKRRCVLDDSHDTHSACVPCQQRKSDCSRTLKPTRYRNLVQSGSSYKQERCTTNDNTHSEWHIPISYDQVIEFTNLYLRYIHDRPHSLFHERTLWSDIRTHQVPDCLVMSICAMGCRVSPYVHQRNLGYDLRKRSSSSFSQQLETISLANIQTCIILANLYAAEQNNALEALYFGIANRMARVLRLHEAHHDDPPILRETKCRVWWTLFVADRWCPPGLGLPREIPGPSHQLDLPMDEVEFQTMAEDAELQTATRSEGLWKYMVSLADILGPIQDLNHSLVQEGQSLDQYDAEQQTSNLAERLQKWYDAFPIHMKMNNSNLDAYRAKGHGGTLVALHLGYHHYCTLLYFRFLSAAASELPSENSTIYAHRCRYHALCYSKLLSTARDKGDCQVVYLTVAHMTRISSSVLLHTLLFGDDDDEINTVRTQLTQNFEALVELKRYWPLSVETATKRLLTFQKACLKSTDSETHKVDRWMVRFLLEHALPLGDKEVIESPESSTGHTEWRLRRTLTEPTSQDAGSKTTNMLSEVFADLCR